ncbi:MAG: ribosome maturation factor RimM [Gammaproteobacteria bacterium]
MTDTPVIIAQVGRPFGVAGWVFLQSFTDPITRLFDYGPWLIQMPGHEAWQALEVETWRSQQNGLVAKLKGCDDRTMAQSYTGARIAVIRDILPTLEESSFYWQDLEGLEVVTEGGQSLGTVLYMHNQGASDVMVIENKEKKMHMPFVLGQVVKAVELDEQRIVVDWDMTLNQVVSAANDDD